MKELIKILKKCKYLFYVAPLALGTYGYMVDYGHPFWHSLYGAMAMYFVNPVYDERNNIILVASIWSVLVTANFIITMAQGIFGSLGHFFLNRLEDSTAVYGEEEMVENYMKTSKHSYAGKVSRRHISGAKNIVVMYEDDFENINFVNDHLAELKDRKVYIQLKDVDSFLLGKSDLNIHYFNTFELLSRKYWKDYPINYKEIREKKNYKIAVIGFNQMGRTITRYGILDNIFDLNQQIEYHLFGVDSIGRLFFNELELMNDDRIIIHDESAEDSVKLLLDMDRIIVLEDKDMRITQELLYKSKLPTIYFYTNASIKMSQIFESDKIIAFGDVESIMNDACIRKESLIKAAKLFNFDYNRHYGYGTGDAEMDWAALNGFLKGSNIARADHYKVERNMLDDGVPQIEVLELEHIRWGRYHYVNHWSYAPERNNKLRQHNLLVPFEELSEDKKSLDGISDPELEKEILKYL